MKLNFNNNSRLLLIGGDKMLMKVAYWAYENNFSVEVILSTRHANEVIRGHANNLKELLDSKKIKNHVIDDIESPEAIKIIGDTENTICISICASWIFKKNMIETIFNGRLLNLHEARLPIGRGGGGISWKILSGDRLGASVLHLIAPKIDAGEIIMAQHYVYPPDECRIPFDYYRYNEERSYDLICDFLTKARSGDSFYSSKQPNYLSTYWPRLHTKTHAWIDWSWSAEELERFICAFDDPYNGAQTMICGRNVHLKNSVRHYGDSSFHPFQSGSIYRKNKNWLCVSLSDGALLVQSVTDENGDEILCELKEGDRFYTPQKNLLYKARKVQFTPSGFKGIVRDI